MEDSPSFLVEPYHMRIHRKIWTGWIIGAAIDGDLYYTTQPGYSQGAILSGNLRIRSSIHPDRTPSASLPNLGSTLVLHCACASKEYCPQSACASHLHLHSSAESASPSSVSLRLSHPSRGAIMRGMMYNSKISLWRRTSVLCVLKVSTVQYSMHLFTPVSRRLTTL